MPAFYNKLKQGFHKLTKDPAVFISVIIIWIFLSIFILFPLAKIFILTFEKGGHFTFANITEILSKRNHFKAFWNSLLLATLVGISGTTLGFFFAFTSVRANLSKGWSKFLDAAIILPLISKKRPVSI